MVRSLVLTAKVGWTASHTKPVAGETKRSRAWISESGLACNFAQASASPLHRSDSVNAPVSSPRRMARAASSYSPTSRKLAQLASSAQYGQPTNPVLSTMTLHR